MITLIGRKIDVNHDYQRRPGIDNPGGGIATKFKYICKALPNIRMASDMEDADYIKMVEMLWFHETLPKLPIEERIKMYKKSNSLKILIISDPSFCRFPAMYVEQIFDITDIILVSSEYTDNWIKAYAPYEKVVYIPDPIDVSEFDASGTNRSKSIAGCSQIGVPKNIEMIIDVYGKLPSDIRKGYIGSKNIWGGYGNKGLEDSLKSVSDWIFPNAMTSEIARIWANTLGYIGDTKYDTFCYAMIEAMASGCWLFLGKHPLYDDKPAFRFDTADEAVELITTHL